MSDVVHILTSEYPPQHGGVSDFTFGLAGQLARHGREVHVWCRSCDQPAPLQTNVEVHPVAGDFDFRSLRRLWQQMDRYPTGVVLVQWVPHGYGYRSLNIMFCLWLWMRARLRKNPTELVVHEAFLAFREGNLRQDVAACIHRLMTLVILRAPRKIWVSTTSWEPLLRPWLLGRRMTFESLPVPNSIPVLSDVPRLQSLRSRFSRRPVWGHFGTYGSNVTCYLEPIVTELLLQSSGSVLLIGSGSDRFRNAFVGKHPNWHDRVVATGRIPADELSLHLSACDAMVQPYPDGVSCRRSTLTASLAHGKPVVTNLGRTSEAWWHTETGVALVDGMNPTAFVDLCRGLEQDEEKRARLARDAESLYQRAFSWGHAMEALAGRSS